MSAPANDMDRILLTLLLLVPCFLLQAISVHGQLYAQDSSNTGLFAFAIFPALSIELAAYASDPCQQLKWVQCSSGNPSRVTAIDLSGRQLYGVIPNFSSLKALVSLNFSTNQLSGSIPDFIGNLPELEKLDLSNNDLSGVVPKSISANSNLQKDLSGNPNLCLSEPCETSPTTSNQGSGSSSNVPNSSKNKKPKKAVEIAVSPFFIVWAAFGGYLIMKHRERVQATIQGRLQGVKAQINGMVMMDQTGQQEQYGNDEPLHHQPEKDYVPLRP